MSRRPTPQPARNRNHNEIDALVSQYSHEKQRPREAEALQTLKKIASLVKPLMRARGWRVGTLSEFYPDDQSLLGLNKNKGQAIYLRLRYPGDANQFLPLEQVTDTMLHELSHIVWGPHDENFHALWEELRKEYEGLVSKGYTGEGFLSEGRRLGGKRIPRDEAKRIRRVAAEKRAVLSKGSGQKLGGAAVPLGSDMRKVIADAIERRSTITKGCGSGGNRDAQEIQAISDQANQNGVRTQAEEDKANEAAIEQALWELHQEDEKQKYGNAYVPPGMAGAYSGFGSGSSADVTSNQSSSSISARSLPQVGPRSFSSVSLGASSIAPPAPPVQPNSRPASRLVPLLPAKRPPPSSSPQNPNSKSDSVVTSTTTSNEIPISNKFWTCPACTFAENPILHLCCDVCAFEQPVSIAQTSTHSTDTLKAGSTSSKTMDLGPKTWVCHRCANEMEHQWWTCSECGTLKLESKS